MGRIVGAIIVLGPATTNSSARATGLLVEGPDGRPSEMKPCVRPHSVGAAVPYINFRSTTLFHSEFGPQTIKLI